MTAALIFLLIAAGVGLVGLIASHLEKRERRQLEAERKAHEPQLTEKQKELARQLHEWEAEFNAPLESRQLPEPDRLRRLVPQHIYDEETTTVVTIGGVRDVYHWCTECGGQKTDIAHEDYRKRELEEHL